MKIVDIYNYIDSFAPFDTAESWDNSGFLVGDIFTDVSKVLICLDVNSETVAYAKNIGANLIISHHPVIFRAKKAFLSGDICFEAVKNGISIISAHTNLDKAIDGVNDTLCKKLNLQFEKVSENICGGFLNVATFQEEKSPEETALFLKKSLGGAVSYCNGGKNVKKIAVCSGSGGDFAGEISALGCEALITGEASYHDFLDAVSSGVSVFAAGHFETEVIITEALAQKLSQTFVDAEFEIFNTQSPVITVI